MKRTRLCVRNGVITVCIIFLLFFLGVFGSYQNILQDKLFGGSTALNNIVIVGIDDKSIQEIGRWPWNRRVIADLINKTIDSKVVGVDITFSERSDEDDNLAEAIRRSNVVLPIEYPIGYSYPLKPLPEFIDAARAVGVSNLVTDFDGVTRAAATVFDEPLFSEAIAGFLGAPSLPKNQRILINFVGPRGSFKTISAIEVLQNNFNFSNSVVLIGATAPDLHDDYVVPASDGTRVSGVEIHANLLQMILTRSFLNAEPSWLILLVIVFFSIISIVLTSWLHTVTALVVMFLVLFAYLVIAVWIFDFGFILDLVYTPLALVLGTVLNTAGLHMHERKEKHAAIDAFSKYVAPEVVKELFKHPEKLKLGGERRIITIFFSDIRGFTTLSEQLTPEQLVHVLNEYLTAMTDIVMNHSGVVDKYIGDAIMAFWGAPLDQPNHAELACSAALEMIDKLSLLQKRWISQGLPRIDIGIGMTTGPAVIGNMGSHQRFNYTAMGDTVNLGSRLEGLTKEYKVNVIISESTKNLLPSSFVTRELDLVRVKGKKEPIRIYELCTSKKSFDLFSKGLVKYRAGEFSSARKFFKEAFECGDMTAGVFVERCDHLDKHRGNWDGVWVMHTK